MSREEKKMQELEKLLNSLIQRGWKPWGKYDKILNVSKNHGWLMRMVESNNVWMYVHIRSIVSLESGLWQFCIEQKLCRDVEQSRAIHSAQSFATGPSYPSIRDYQYRLLESALIPEKELAQFLLDNIKVE